MMFQPQFYGLKSVVAVYKVVNVIYKVVKRRESFLPVYLLFNNKEKPRFLPSFMV